MSDDRGIADITLVSEQQWAEARRCLPVISKLANISHRTAADIAAAVNELGRSRSTVFVLLKRYQADPCLTSLVPHRGGPSYGSSRLAAEIDRLVDDAIESFYLTRQRPRISDLVTEIHRRCHAKGFRAPSRKAITARVRAKPASVVMERREGKKAASNRFRPVTGLLEASAPLSLVQIDHTLVDVIVVDSVTRLPIQRPWITLAIDVYCRVVLGFYLSLEPPSATSVALCISHAVLPKEGWLAERDIDEQWPVSGLFTRLHLDNGKDFRSEALRRGCEQYGIAIDYRPVRTPHYGGHIERLIGTMMGQVHLLPGTTFSDVRMKGDLDPEKTAAMTVDEVERWLAHQIAGVYHRSEHRSLNVPPLVAWERGIVGEGAVPGCGEPTAITDARRFLIDFLPIERRLIRRDGVSLHRIHYWSDTLRRWVGTKEKRIVRYDPRDLSRIYVLVPDGQYVELGYRDLRCAPISLWEHRLALKHLRDEGRVHIDEAAIFASIDKMREIVDEAVTATKSARRQQARRLRLIKGGRDEPVTTLSPDDDDEPLSGQPHENMLPWEEWT